ncbi:MAG: EpsI family protein [Gemmatimonadota bacterium]|nr:EpsI family protein [Gemmatimonadota bacterium]
MTSELKAYLPALMLALGSAMVGAARGQRAIPLTASIEGVLPSVEGYQARNQTIGDEERRVAGMTHYVARAYLRDSLVAFTTLVSYYDRQTGGKSIHSPRNCLPGAGWDVVSGGTQAVTAGGATYTVNRYVLKNGRARAVVYYWYQGRGRVVASEYAVKWNLLRDAVFDSHTEEALVRVVVPVRASVGNATPGAESSIAAASTLGTTIARRLISEVDRVLPRSGHA